MSEQVRVSVSEEFTPFRFLTDGEVEALPGLFWNEVALLEAVSGERACEVLVAVRQVLAGRGVVD